MSYHLYTGSCHLWYIYTKVWHELRVKTGATWGNSKSTTATCRQSENKVGKAQRPYTRQQDGWGSSFERRVDHTWGARDVHKRFASLLTAWKNNQRCTKASHSFPLHLWVKFDGWNCHRGHCPISTLLTGLFLLSKAVLVLINVKLYHRHTELPLRHKIDTTAACTTVLSTKQCPLWEQLKGNKWVADKLFFSLLQIARQNSVPQLKEAQGEQRTQNMCSHRDSLLHTPKPSLRELWGNVTWARLHKHVQQTTLSDQCLKCVKQHLRCETNDWRCTCAECDTIRHHGEQCMCGVSIV